MWRLDRGRGGTKTGCENSAFIGLSSQTDVQKETQKVQKRRREGQLCIKREVRGRARIWERLRDRWGIWDEEWRPSRETEKKNE